MQDVGWLWLIIALVLVAFVTLIAFLRRYKRCPPDKIMVIYGRVGASADGRRSARCIHGGAAFVWPLIQAYDYLDLEPFVVPIDLANALSQEISRGGETYYLHWLRALEALVAAKGVASNDELIRLQWAWRNAAMRTPHGAPIVLSDED